MRARGRFKKRIIGGSLLSLSLLCEDEQEAMAAGTLVPGDALLRVADRRERAVPVRLPPPKARSLPPIWPDLTARGSGLAAKFDGMHNRRRPECPIKSCHHVTALIWDGLYVVAICKINLPARRGCASLHLDYVSRSVPSNAGHRFSKSPSRWSSRSNRASICC